MAGAFFFSDRCFFFFEQKGLIPNSCRLARLLFIVHLGALEGKKKHLKEGSDVIKK